MCLNPYNNKGGKRQGGCHTTSNSTSRALYIILYVCLLNNISPFRFLSYKRKINNQNKILKKKLTSVNVSIPLHAHRCTKFMCMTGHRGASDTFRK